MTYQTYKKVDQLALEYLPEDRYNYCDSFCNNNILDRLLSGDITKKELYKYQLEFVFTRLKQYCKTVIVLEREPWFKKLLEREGLTSNE